MITTTRAFGAAALGIGLLLAGAIHAHPAHAGTYVMRNCDVPGHPNAPLAPWGSRGMYTGAVMVDSCASGGGLGFTLGENRQMYAGNASIGIVKPTGARSQITFVKAVLWYAARLTSAGEPVSFYAVDYRTDGTVITGLTNSAPGSENLVAEQRLSSETRDYVVGIHCGQPTGVQSGNPCFLEDRVPLLLRGMEVTLREDVEPAATLSGGTLLEPGALSGPRTLAYVASDQQSGLARVDVLLEDAVIATRDFTTGCLYSDFTVCPESREETLQIDTRAVANGPHRLTLRVTDAAGNVRVVHGPSINVANAAIPAAAPAYTLSARFKGSRRSTLTIPYGRKVVIQGRLSVGSQPGPAGAEVAILEKVTRGRSREVPVGKTRTRPGGSFSYVLSTTRRSRTVRLVYQPLGGSQAISQVLTLRVRAAARLRASLRGRVIRFSGRVLSRPLPRNGKRVLMEGRAPGSAWTSFAHLRSGRNGRFSGTYRLRVRRPGVRLKIRAVVPTDKGYGYLTGRSRAITLRVR